MKVIDHINQAKSTLFSFEILPPLKGKRIDSIYESIDPLLEFSPNFINVTYHREEYVYKKREGGYLEKVSIRKRPGTVGICAAIINKYNDLITEKIRLNTNMYASIFAIQGLQPDKYADVFKALDAGLSKKYPRDQSVIRFHAVVTQMLGTVIGAEAPDIRLPAPDGHEIALSSLKGKVVLVDFWASWCGPCRKEMPNVVKAYAKYKNKGFEIFGVSLDKEKDKWVEAIQVEGITWPQVSDLQYWNSEVVKQYSIEGIPYTVLLDKEGKIIAKNLRGAELDKKLAEVLLADKKSPDLKN